MFTYDELNQIGQKRALVVATAMSLQSNEWMHVLATAKLIKRGLQTALNELEADLPLLDIPALMNAESLERLSVFSSFDMPASFRIAADMLKELANEKTLVSDAIQVIESDLEDSIQNYWHGTFTEINSVFDWIESVDMLFSKDGEIASFDANFEIPQNFEIVCSLNGNEETVNIKTLRSLMPIAKPLALIFKYNDKDQNNLTIQDLMKFLIEFAQQGKINTVDGESKVCNSDYLVAVEDQKVDFTLDALLGFVADCLAFSDKVDSFMEEAAFKELYKVDQVSAEFLEYAYSLYSLDNVCDTGSVREHDSSLFLELR